MARVRHIIRKSLLGCDFQEPGLRYWALYVSYFFEKTPACMFIPSCIFSKIILAKECSGLYVYFLRNFHGFEKYLYQKEIYW